VGAIAQADSLPAIRRLACATAMPQVWPIWHFAPVASPAAAQVGMVSRR